VWRKTGKQKAWIGGFLGVTFLAILMELIAAFDPTMETIPWTDLIVEYVPMEIAAVAFGALAIWLPVHFGRRYYMRSKGLDWRAGARKKRARDNE